MTEIALKLVDIHKSFGSSKIINGVNLEVAKKSCPQHPKFAIIPQKWVGATPESIKFIMTEKNTKKGWTVNGVSNNVIIIKRIDCPLFNSQ